MTSKDSYHGHSVPPGGGFERERGGWEPEKSPGNMRMIPKPLLEADAPYCDAHEGPGS